MSGIFTQSAPSILDDVVEFYFGGTIPWIIRRHRDGSRIDITMWNPDGDEIGDPKVYSLTGGDIKKAYFSAKSSGAYLCCARDIENEGLGYGCAQDLDVVLQTATYGKVIFA